MSANGSPHNNETDLLPAPRDALRVSDERLRSLRHYKETLLSELQKRIDKLEFELVHQQRITEQLNETVTEQTKELLHLGRVVDRLARQFADLRKSPGTTEPAPTLEDEKPPHY